MNQKKPKTMSPSEAAQFLYDAADRESDEATRDRMTAIAALAETFRRSPKREPASQKKPDWADKKALSLKATKIAQRDKEREAALIEECAKECLPMMDGDDCEAGCHDSDAARIRSLRPDASRTLELRDLRESKHTAEVIAKSLPADKVLQRFVWGFVEELKHQIDELEKQPHD
jgi:hypothetical protein